MSGLWFGKHRPTHVRPRNYGHWRIRVNDLCLAAMSSYVTCKSFLPLVVIFTLTLSPYAFFHSYLVLHYKMLNHRRETARRAVSVEILSTGALGLNLFIFAVRESAYCVETIEQVYARALW